MPDPRQSRTLGFAACFLASALWGCGFYFGKIALAEMNVGQMVLYRLASDGVAKVLATLHGIYCAPVKSGARGKGRKSE